MSDDKRNAIDARMQELNDMINKAHAEQDEFRARTQFYREAEKSHDGFRQDFEVVNELVLVVRSQCESGGLLECPLSLAELLWKVLREWQEAEKQKLVQELEASPEPKPEKPHPMLCITHGGSRAGFDGNKEHGFTCPRCADETPEPTRPSESDMMSGPADDGTLARRVSHAEHRHDTFVRNTKRALIPIEESLCKLDLQVERLVSDVTILNRDRLQWEQVICRINALELPSVIESPATGPKIKAGGCIYWDGCCLGSVTKAPPPPPKCGPHGKMPTREPPSELPIPPPKKGFTE